MAQKQQTSVYPITIYVKAKSKQDAIQLNEDMKDFYEFDSLMLRAIKDMARQDPTTFRGVIKKALNGDTKGAIAAVTQKALGGIGFKNPFGGKK